MSVHVTDCKRPSWWKRRFVHRPWICDECGQAWRTRYECTYGGGAYLWERWPSREGLADWGLLSPEVDDS